MATLMVFLKPRGFELPNVYKRINNENDNTSFINKIESDVEGYNKHILGRHFNKTSKVFVPSETGITEEEVTKPKSVCCFVYTPTDTSNNRVFLVGSFSASLLPDMLSFADVSSINNEPIDIQALEKNSFTSGRIGLIGHKYSTSNRTINYTVRKIDGIPFRRQDPEFVSYDDAPKEVLEVKLELDEDTKPTFYVYADGKITRRGQSETETSDFDLLITVYNILKQITSQ